MRYCNQCHRVTVGEPLFCNFCGRSYNEKVCPRRHVNPRNAEVCSECGSRDLSLPAPPVGIWTRIAVQAAIVVPAVFLILLSLAVLAALLEGLRSNLEMILVSILPLIFLLGVLWFIYLQIPPTLRKLFRSLWRKSKRRPPRQ